MFYYLAEDEVTKLDKLYYCNHCGNVATQDYISLRSDELNWQCTCEGAKLSSEYSREVHSCKEALDKSIKKYYLHKSNVHSSIRERLYNNEVEALKLKYKID